MRGLPTTGNVNKFVDDSKSLHYKHKKDGVSNLVFLDKYNRTQHIVFNSSLKGRML